MAGRSALVWAAVAVAIVVPLLATATSPLLAWRDPVYVVAGFAGVIALALLLVQPLLIGGLLPGVTAARGRILHRVIGAGLVVAVVVHVAALWITSPPDVVDALLFASPAPFSVWGVVAMWAVFGAGAVAALRRRFRGRLPLWRRVHTGLAAVVVTTSVVHAVLVVGTMEVTTKTLLCAVIMLVAAKVIADKRGWTTRRRNSP
jgi:hypothetical protein